MGRVDEAMRRAAEAAMPRIGDQDAARESRDGARAPLAYPSEIADRPRSGQPGAVSTRASEAPDEASLIPPVGERIDLRFQRKIVVDQGIDPGSREQYRRLAAGLHAAQSEGGLKVVMMASAVAGEGKSLTSSNLALTFSESYRRNVLLVDADLRRPTLHTVFGLQLSPGLSDGLVGASEGRMRLQRVSAGLTVLTAGQPTSDPMAILSSDRMRRLVIEARETFDWVLIDTPPIGLLSDASLLSQIADGALLVVKAGSTPYDLVQRAVEALGKERVLGVVLNLAEASHAGGYKYSAYYKTHSTDQGAR